MSMEIRLLHEGTPIPKYEDIRKQLKQNEKLIATYEIISPVTGYVVQEVKWIKIPEHHFELQGNFAKYFNWMNVRFFASPFWTLPYSDLIRRSGRNNEKGPERISARGLN